MPARSPKLKARPQKGLTFERLEDRVTPDVRVFTSGALAVQAGPTFTGDTALYDAVQAGTTLDGYFVVADTVTTASYKSPGLIPKSLTLLGPNAAISPNTGTRAREVNIDTTPWANAPAGYVSIAEGKTVSVRGFAFATATGVGAVTAFSSNYAVDFRYNIVRNQTNASGLLYFRVDGSTPYTAATVSENRFEANAATGTAIRISGPGDNAVVTNNVVIGGLMGVSLETSTPYGVVNPIVSNNYIEGTQNEGIRIGNYARNAVVTYNTVKNANAAPLEGRGGIRVVGSSPSAPGPFGTLTLTNNLVTGSNGGLIFGSGAFPALTAVTIRANAIYANPGTALVSTGNIADATLDLSGNWLGSNDPATIAAGLLGTRNALVQAYLSANTNARTGALVTTSGQWGFVPVVPAVEMWVPQRAATSGLAKLDGAVQTGVALALDGMTVRLDADTYTETVTVPGNESLTIKGIAPNKATVNGTLTAAGGTAGTALKLIDFAVTGGGSAAGYGNLLFASTGAAPGTYTVSASALTRAGDQPTGPFALSGLGTLTVSAGSGADTFTVSPAPLGGTTIVIDGNDPAAAPGDTINVLTVGAISPVAVGSAASGSYSAANKQIVSWTRFEALAGPADGDAAPPVVAGTAVGMPYVCLCGGDAITVSGTATDNTGVTAAEYSVNGGAWKAMAAADGNFGGKSEAVTAAFTLAAAGITAKGTYTVAVRARDAVGNVSAPGTATVRVADANGEVFVSGTDLVVIGTCGNDKIDVRYKGNDDDDDDDCGSPSAPTYFVRLGTGGSGYAVQKTVAAAVNRIVILGCDGNDRIKISGRVTAPAFVFGGDGNDRINLGGGNSVAVGGEGCDTVDGGGDRNILIGGNGSDDLNAHGGQDLLIGGTTAHDNNLAALTGVLGVWTGNGVYVDRVNALKTTAPYRLNGGTVFDDGDADDLRGGSGLDWYFASTSAADWRKRDRVYGAGCGEIITLIPAES